MKSHKSTDLYSFLDVKEQFFLNNVTLSKHELNSLLKHFREKHDEKQKPSNYLERNHLRHAVKKIKSFLAEKTFKQSTDWQNYFYLSELFNRNAFDLFDKEIKQILRKSENETLSLQMILIKELQLERMVAQSIISKEQSILIHKLLMSIEKDINNYNIQFNLKAETLRKHLSFINPDVPVKPIAAIATTSSIIDKINIIKYTIYSEPNIDQKIKHHKVILKLCNKKQSPILKREYANSCANMATYLMLLGKFKASETYIHTANTFKSYFRPSNYLMLLFNYVGLCLRNKQFITAFTLVQENDKALDKFKPIAYKWKLLKAMCYALVHREKEIKSILPEKPNKKDSSDYIYFYLIWAIYFIKIEKNETAGNMIQTAFNIYNRKGKDKGLQQFILIVKQYLKLRIRYTSAKSAKILLEQINNLNFNEFSQGNILPLIWIQEYLKTIA